MALMNEELEQYRKQAIKIVKQNAGFIRDTARDVLGAPCREVYIVGSVLDRTQFSEDSDIDVAVVIEGPVAKDGLDEQQSEKLQNEMQRWPMDDIGVVNTLVFINKMQLARGKAMKIAVDM
jgi:predicted nucleotidyltransferase